MYKKTIKNILLKIFICNAFFLNFNLISMRNWGTSKTLDFSKADPEAIAASFNEEDEFDILDQMPESDEFEIQETKKDKGKEKEIETEQGSSSSSWVHNLLYNRRINDSFYNFFSNNRFRKTNANENIALSFRKKPKIKFENLVNETSFELLDIIEDLRDGNITFKKNKNIILLGPPGSGKSTAAEAIASALDCDFYFLKAGTLITPFQGSASSTLDIVFRYIENQKKPAVVFIDEIDAIVNKDVNDNNGESLRATMALQCLLDGNCTISIFATNYPEKLPEAFKSRCTEVAIALPNNAAILNFFKKQLEERRAKTRYTILENVKDDILEQIINELKEANYRDLQKISDAVVIIARDIQENNEHFSSNNDILTYQAYLIAILRTQNYPINSIKNIKLLLKYYLLKDNLSVDFTEDIFDKIAAEAVGLTARQIRESILNAKRITPRIISYKLDLEDMYAGIYYNQNNKFSSKMIKISIFKHFMKDKPRLNITDFIYQDIAEEFIDSLNSKDLKEVVYNAEESSQLRKFKVIKPFDLYLGLYHVLSKKAKPCVVSLTENKNYTPVNNFTKSHTTSDESSTNMGGSYFSRGYRNSKAETTSSNNYTWISNETKSHEIRELTENEKFSMIKTEGDSGIKITRLDQQTDKMPGYNLRLAIIKYFMHNIDVKINKEDLSNFAAITSGLSCHTISELIKLSQYYWIQRKSNGPNSASSGINQNDLTEAAKKLNIVFNLNNKEVVEEKKKLEDLKANAKKQLKPENNLINRNVISRLQDINFKYPQDGKTLLNRECSSNKFGIGFIELLLEHGANPNIADNSLLTPLINLIKSDKFSLNDKAAGIAMLIGKEADINVKDNNGLTPITIACLNLNLSAIEKLIGADFKIKDKYGLTPFTYMIIKSISDQKIYSDKKFIDIINRLINEEKIDISEENKAKIKALFKNDVKPQNNIDVKPQNNTDVKPQNNTEILNFFKNYITAEINKKDKNNNIALMHAVNNNNLWLVKLLIENKSDVNAKNNDGNTALILAAEYNFTSPQEQNINNEIIKAILNCENVDYSIKNNKNLTAKEIATSKKKNVIIDLIDKKSSSCILF